MPAVAASSESVLTPAWTTLRYHPKQFAAFTSKKRFILIPAGRGSGKTELARRKLVMELPRKKPYPDPRYFYAADTVGKAKSIAWSQLLALIPRHWLAGKPRESKDSMEIKTKFGSVLRLFGMAKATAIEGLQWDGGVIDESCDCPPGGFALSIVPALTHRDGWCWRIGVPKRRGPGAAEYRRAYEEALRGEDPDSEGYSWPSSDILSPEKLAWARKHLDPKDFREQFEACFVTAGGRIFYAFDRARNVRPVAYDKRRPIVVGCDFNVDPMCWSLGHRTAHTIEWFDEIFLRDTNTVESIKCLLSRYADHVGGFEFYPDASGQQRKTSAAESDYKLILGNTGLRAKGLNVFSPSSNPRIADRFADCNAMWENADGDTRMWVSPSCVHLIDDLENRSYKQGTCDPDDKPGSDMGHMSDALGYAVSYLFPIRVEQVVQPGTVTISTQSF